MNNPYLEQYRQDTLRKAQLRQLEILKTIAAICESNDIPYWLDAGTLLGAVRHDGFIPWDDDIDVSMRAEDLERFIQVAPKLLPEGMVLQTPTSDPTIKGEAYKVRLLNSFYVEGADDNYATYQKGLFVDLFPFVNYPSHLQGLTRKVARGICIAYNHLHSPHYFSLRTMGESLYFGCKLSICRLLWYTLQPLARSGKHTCSRPIYNWHGTIYTTASIFPLSTITFEGINFRAPGNPNAYLKAIYRNYMQLPPEDKRMIHSIFMMPELIKKD
ncbi:MAG: LicD family protein [Bacteroidaceae bacterium]